MAWAVPVALALFWLTALRKVTALPTLWYPRAAAVQTGIVVDFIVPVVGAAAWMGSRETRRRTADILATVAVPRSNRLLMTWAATTCWAIAGFLICAGAAYGATVTRATFGGPLWWPAAVGAACLPAFAAIGLAAGSLFPSRFTAPAAAVIAFFAFALSTELITGSQSPWQVSPLVGAAWDIGPDAGIATFYPYQPDLAIAQLMFLAGLTITILAALATRPGSGPRRQQALAAGLAAVGLLTTGTAVTLVGTGRLDRTGMITIPALHDAARDRPLPITPACSHGPIPICVNPAYAGYLPAISAAFQPLLGELAGLPHAPARLSQIPTQYQQGQGNEVRVNVSGIEGPGSVRIFPILLTDQLNGQGETDGQIASQVLAETAPDLADNLTQADRSANPAQQAIALALLMAVKAPSPPGGRGLPPVLEPGSAGYAAAVKFAALPPETRRAWLAGHLAGLRAGRLTLADLP